MSNEWSTFLLKLFIVNYLYIIKKFINVQEKKKMYIYFYFKILNIPYSQSGIYNIKNKIYVRIKNIIYLYDQNIFLDL
jgi:hypothetical protein